MRIAVCLLYIILNILYLTVKTEYTMIAGGINIITHIGFIGYLCFLLEKYKGNSENERLFFGYLKYLSVADCVYIVFCLIRGKFFAIHNTDFFAFVTAVTLAVLLLHIANKHSNHK